MQYTLHTSQYLNYLIKGIDDNLWGLGYLWFSCAATRVQKKQWILRINPFHITSSMKIRYNILGAHDILLRNN
jgi:hypothetical protein